MTALMNTGRACVALGPASAHRQTLWCRTASCKPDVGLGLRQQPGRRHARDEVVQTRHLTMPQARETFAFIGSRAGEGYGLDQGVNEHQLVAGYLPHRGRFSPQSRGLRASDLVQLALERCRGAAQASEVLTGLIAEHGQGCVANDSADAEHDGLFLLADPREAVVLETAGRYWAVQSVREVRALACLPTIRQDWNRVSPGLGTLAIQEGWWPEDGRKIDFAGVVAGPADPTLLRAWGQLTFRLEQANGRIDLPFMRETLAGDGQEVRLIAQLESGSGRLPIVWFWVGGPLQGVYLPLFVEGELPEKLRRPAELAFLLESLHPKTERDRLYLEERLADLQARLDQDADAFAVEGAELRPTGEDDDRRRLATLFMEHAIERLVDCLPAPRAAAQRFTAAPAAEWSWL